MEWLPSHLLHHNLANCSAWSQHVKQSIMMIAGIETKSQDEMNKGQREDCIYSEYMNWVEILAAKHPRASVNGWLEYTTGTKTVKVTGAYLYRNFQEGLRVFHNELNKVWTLTIAEGNSGKSKEEVWKRFCYLYSCKREKSEPDATTPDDFDLGKIETLKWIYTYKHQGPPCEFLQIGRHSCHEFLASPKGLALRSTGTKKRRAEKLSRKASREIKARKTKIAVTEAFASRKQMGTLQLGRTQMVNNYLVHAEKVSVCCLLYVCNVRSPNVLFYRRKIDSLNVYSNCSTWRRILLKKNRSSSK